MNSPTDSGVTPSLADLRRRLEELRQEHRDIRVSIVSPGPVESELADTITHAETARMVAGIREFAISADSIARSSKTCKPFR